MGKGHCRLDWENRTEGNGQLERGKVKGEKDLCSLGMPYWELIKGALINKINERRGFRMPYWEVIKGSPINKINASNSAAEVATNSTML